MAKAKIKKKPVKKVSVKKAVVKKVKPAAKPQKKVQPPKPKVVKDIIKTTENKVRTYLKQMFKKNFQEFDGRFILTEGSAIVQIVVRPWYDNDSVIDIFSFVVEGANITPDLTNFLLRKNATLHFGAFGLTYDNGIIFTYSLAGANLDFNELKSALMMVATISDYYDDEIVKIAGGKRGIDVKEMAMVPTE
jgi:hypothetical protein